MPLMPVGQMVVETTPPGGWSRLLLGVSAARLSQARIHLDSVWAGEDRVPESLGVCGFRWLWRRAALSQKLVPSVSDPGPSRERPAPIQNQCASSPRRV